MISTRSAAVVVAFTLLGCSSETAASSDATLTQEEKDGILMYLTAQGFDVTHILFESDSVVVEGDIVFRLHELVEASTGMVNKGYRSDFSLLPDVANNLDLVLVSSLPSAWKTAFRAAAVEWTNATWGGVNINVNISEANTGPDVTVYYLALQLDQLCTFATANYPTFAGTPGDIRVNAWYSEGGCGCTLTPSLRQRIAAHEIGHVLGMKHPEGSPASEHIPNTSSGTGYSTVMHANFCSGLLLTSDDKESAFELYD